MWSSVIDLIVLSPKRQEQKGKPMNDLISRQAVIDLFPNDALEWDTYWGYIAPHFARRMIEELPSAQPEIIRCKDCAKRTFTKCPMAIGRQSDYDFCSRAERKDE